MPESEGNAAPQKLVQKRQRIKPETRRELIQRLENPQLTLHEAALLLNVCRATVRRHCKEGTLKSFRTPGGQRRFYYQDIKDFIRKQPRKKR
jgi:excisionase family DNA binding protein